MALSVRTFGIVALVLCVISGMDAGCFAQDGVSVVVNELLASNRGNVSDPQGEYDDWIELYNPTDSPIDVGGMYLTDDAGDPTQWQLPAGNPSLTRIAAGGFLVVWADGDTADTGLHASFRLNAGGDEVRLYAGDGRTLIDRIEYGKQSADVSLGRFPDGADSWRFLGFPTPGATNVPVYEGFVDDLQFSHERGFYDAPFELTIGCDTPGVTIYYTLDGRQPLEDADRGVATGAVYTGPIFVFGTTTVRACVSRTDGSQALRRRVPISFSVTWCRSRERPQDSPRVGAGPRPTTRWTPIS